jgi:hypothetical protein
MDAKTWIPPKPRFRTAEEAKREQTLHRLPRRRRRRQTKHNHAVGGMVISSRYTSIGRADLRGRRPSASGVPLSNDEMALWIDVRAITSLASVRDKLVNVFVTSTCRKRHVPPDVASFDTNGVATARLRVLKRVPSGALVHISILDVIQDLNGLHALHETISQGTVPLDELVRKQSLNLRVYDQLGNSKTLGDLTVSLSTNNTNVPVIDAYNSIARPPVRTIQIALAEYARVVSSKTWDKYKNNVRYPDGQLYIHEDSKDAVVTHETPSTLLMFLYGATRLRVSEEHADEFADAQIRAGCLLCGVSPADLSKLDDTMLKLVLCHAAKALSWSLSAYDNYRGSPFAIPLAASAGIGQFAGVCVEHSVLVATVLMHIRDGKSAMCARFRPIFKTHRIAQLVMTFWLNAGPDVPAKYHMSRHMITALVPRDQTLEADPAKNHRDMPGEVLPVYLLDTISNMPISVHLKHPGITAEEESRALAGIFPSEWDSKKAFTDKKHYLGSCEKVFYVDDDSDIKEAATFSMNNTSGTKGAVPGAKANPTLGIDMIDFWNGLVQYKHRLWSPKSITPADKPLSLFKTFIDETRYLSNIRQDPSIAFYLSDASHLYEKVKATIEKERSKALGKKLGWRVALYNWEPTEATEDLHELLNSAVLSSNTGAAAHGMKYVSAAEIGHAVFYDSVRVTVCLITYWAT